MIQGLDDGSGNLGGKTPLESPFDSNFTFNFSKKNHNYPKNPYLEEEVEKSTVVLSDPKNERTHQETGPNQLQGTMMISAGFHLDGGDSEELVYSPELAQSMDELILAKSVLKAEENEQQMKLKKLQKDVLQLEKQKKEACEDLEVIKKKIDS